MIDASLNLVESWSEAASFMSWIREPRQVLAVDTETGGFNWWRDPLRLVQFGDVGAGWAVPWDLWRGMICEVLATYRGDIVFHNAKFDIKYLEHNGATLDHSKVHDTMAMAHLLDSSSSVALKTLGVRYVDRSASDGQSELKKAMAANRWTWATIPTNFEAYWVYAALDTVITACLYQQFQPQITGRLRDVYELEIASTLILNEMEKLGTRIDLDYCHEKREELLTFAAATKEWAQTTYRCAIGSNPQLAAALQREGVVLRKRTDSGAWSVDESVLERVDHPLASAALAQRTATKTANAYFGKFIELADGDVLHPNVRPLGARTGRMSITDPPLQQMPADSPLVRDAFIPRDGNRLLSVDYDQVEMRLLANLSRDQGLINAFAEEGDFFTNMARLIYADDSIIKSDPRRNVSKHASYAKIFGAGIPKFAKTAGITEPEAAQFLARYDARFPGVKLFQAQVNQVASQRVHDEGVAYVCTKMGRRQTVDRDVIYKLVNHAIQGGAADVLKSKIVELDNADLVSELVLPVHDELIFDVPADEVEDRKEAVIAIMEDRTDVVPLTVGADIVTRWGDKYRG